MDSIDRQKRMRDARHRLRAQHQRAGQLRGRVVAISLIGFALLWAIVFVQMATGNDPILGDSSSLASASQRSRVDSRGRTKAKAKRTESNRNPTSEEPVIATSGPTEATESAGPKQNDSKTPESEPTEVEPEPEPAPITTGQS